MERPMVGVGVLVCRGGKVLMLRRINAHGAGTWSLPGGHLEYHETLEHGARREVLEETGIRIKKPVVAALTNDLFSEGKHYVTIFMKALALPGEARILEPDKSDAIGWFRWKELPRPLFLPIENLLKQGFAIEASGPASR